MKEFLLKAVLFVCGVLLLPFCAASTWALASLVGSVQPESLFALPVAAWAFASGFGLWLFVFFALPRPVITYVLSHELTHALWAALMGAEVRRIRLSNQSGSVVLSKSNILITLAPYFFPLYTIIVIAVYYLRSLFLDTGQNEWILLVL
ncbi:MAG: M50 family metallopeptidase [bacterium]